jgi:hypothetical protein
MIIAEGRVRTASADIGQFRATKAAEPGCLEYAFAGLVGVWDIESSDEPVTPRPMP